MINKNKFLCFILILITIGMSLSLVAAHPGHGEYTPEEVVSPSESSDSPASSSSSSSYSDTSSSSSSYSSSEGSSQSGSSSQGSSSSYSSSSSSSGGYSQSDSSGSYQDSVDYNDDPGADDSQTDNVDSKDNNVSKKTDNVTDNNTNNTTGPVKSSNEDSLFNLTNIVILIFAFLLGFAAIVLLRKINVI